MSDEFSKLLDLLPDLLRVTEVARFCNVDRMTVHNWIKAGQLEATMVGNQYRITKADLRKFLEDDN